MTRASNWPDWLDDWPIERAQQRFSGDHHGDFLRWQAAIERIPALKLSNLDLTKDAVGGEISASPEQLETLESCLKELHPWRKGPFQIGSIYIDTEWRSNYKWRRLAPALGSVANKTVLDIGGGNGYFGWRMLGAGAKAVVNIDPTLVFCMQHRALQRLFHHPNHWVLPLGIEEVPSTTAFDWVLSMGVLYHRKDPQEHIQQMYALTDPNGRCVMETLVVDANQSLYPEGRYARMRNIGVVPNLVDLRQWMHNAGYRNIQLVDVSPTTHEEQRTTPWMHFESLDKALDPANKALTVEGLPAPLRAMLIAER